MSIAKKVAVPAILGALLLSGSVFAANQSASVVLGPSSLEVESNRINGTTGSGTLLGYLNSASTGNAIIEAKRVVAYFPDDQIAQFTISSTATHSQSLNNMTPEDALYYAELNRSNPFVSSDATGVIRNY